MSRDKRLNRTQEVVGSIPISSTNIINHFLGYWIAGVVAPRISCRLSHSSRLNRTRGHRASESHQKSTLQASIAGQRRTMLDHP